MLPPLHAPMEAFATLSRCTSSSELGQRVGELAAAYGVQYWLYAVDLPLVNDRREQFTLGGYPEGWVNHYLACDYLRIDPIVAHCHDHATPLNWARASEELARGQDPRTRRVRQMFGEAAEFGLGAGISIPLHGPGAGWGLMSFAAHTWLAPRLAAHTAELHLLAHFVHEQARRYCRATPASRQPNDVPRLTRREREALYWASAGKTSWEIGQLLGISERTVIFHMQNASQKLGVSGRQAAVARAVAMGLIAAH